mmetsp:Transcript_4750/g.13424  ORF Transcript_4750/g.13424 Transcript_4750/m.13424 type:complete len:160 (-) Transcript_4750:1577-2056(-)
MADCETSAEESSGDDEDEFDFFADIPGYEVEEPTIAAPEGASFPVVVDAKEGEIEDQGPVGLEGQEEGFGGKYPPVPDVVGVGARPVPVEAFLGETAWLIDESDVDLDDENGPEESPALVPWIIVPPVPTPTVSTMSSEFGTTKRTKAENLSLFGYSLE